MIWLFKIDEVFWGNKPTVNEYYYFPNESDIEFDINLYDISLYMGLADYYVLNDVNPDEIYRLYYSGENSNPDRLLLNKNTDYYNVISNYYVNTKTKIEMCQ